LGGAAGAREGGDIEDPLFEEGFYNELANLAVYLMNVSVVVELISKEDCGIPLRWRRS